MNLWGKILLAGPLTSLVFGVLVLPVFIVMKNMENIRRQVSKVIVDECKIE